jgi:hypothetical protein
VGFPEVKANFIYEGIGSYQLFNLEIGFTEGVTGQQGMLPPQCHLIPHLVFPEVRVTLIYNVDYSIT